MRSGGVDRSRIVAEEVDFWGKIAEERLEDSELRVPTASDLADPFAESSDRRFLAMIGPVKNLRVLDIGCGKGSLGLYMTSQGADVTGLDITRGMILRCRRRSSIIKIEVEFVEGDAENLPFRDKCFDRVIGQRTIHHFPDIPRFFEEVKRVLVREGKAVFVEPQKKNPFVEFNRKVLHPEIRTPHEHPLVPADIALARKMFPSIEIETFYLFSPVAYLFRYLVKSDRLYTTARRVLQSAEMPLTGMRGLRPYCWQILMTLPRDDAGLS